MVICLKERLSPGETESPKKGLYPYTQKDNLLIQHLLDRFSQMLHCHRFENQDTSSRLTPRSCTSAFMYFSSHFMMEEFYGSELNYELNEKNFGTLLTEFKILIMSHVELLTKSIFGVSA